MAARAFLRVEPEIRCGPGAGDPFVLAMITPHPDGRPDGLRSSGLRMCCRVARSRRPTGLSKSSVLVSADQSLDAMVRPASQRPEFSMNSSTDIGSIGLCGG